MQGITEGMVRLAAVSMVRDVTDLAGGSLSVGFRAARLFAPDGTAENSFGSTLRWTLKF